MLLDLSPRELALAVLLLVCDAFGLVAGARLLGSRRPGGSRFVRDGLVWFAFGIAWAVVWGAAATLLLRSTFALIRVVTHVLLFVMAPLAIARGVAWIHAGRRSAGLVPVAVGLGMVSIYLWAHLVEPRRIEFTEARVATARAAGFAAPVRIAVLADIQTDGIGAYEEEVFRETAAARPDLVLLPGDFVQTSLPRRFAEQAVRFRALFDLLEPWPRLGVYAVFGDVDPDPELFAGTRVEVLDDSFAAPPGEPGLRVVGLSPDASRRPIDPAVLSGIDAFDGYTVVMGHAPDFAQPVIDGRVLPDALLIAGHTHGGQVVIPGFGPPLTLTAIPRRFAAGGLFSFGPARLCISRGVGLERGFAPRVRFLCRPQVFLIDLVPEP